MAEAKELKGQTITEQWARAVKSVFDCQWGLVDAQYQAGLRVMETMMRLPAGRFGPGAMSEVAVRARDESPRAPAPGYKIAAEPNGRKDADVRAAIENKVAVVTGAASGIGQAVVRELANRGARAVVLVDRSDRVFEMVRSINEAAGRDVAEPKVGDVTSDDFRARVYDEVVGRHGVVQICVPAAGITRDALSVKVDKISGKATPYPIELCREVLGVNLIAPVYWALEMVAQMAEDRHRRGLGRWSPEESVQGAVVFIGSVSSQGNKGQLAYAASKAGLEGAAATLMKEAIFHGIRCAVIHPGFTDTPMVRALGDDYIAKNVLPYTQLRRLIRPAEIADAICFLIANSAVSGELWADAGWHPSA